MKCLYEIKMLIPMKKTYIRISPDIDVLCINSDSCCASAYGDEIYNDSPWLGPRFSIVVPGIEEWVKRYEDATDFAETTTEPSFDWISWHYEGLCFAKAIWELQKSCWKTYANKVFKGICCLANKYNLIDIVCEPSETAPQETKKHSETKSSENLLTTRLCHDIITEQ